MINELRRFINSIASIPHLEAILLFQGLPTQLWDENTLSQRLYLNREVAAIVLKDLVASGVCAPLPDNAGSFGYSPATKEMGEMISLLANYYPRNLIEVTNMIHSKANAKSQVQLFADAFKFNKDK